MKIHSDTEFEQEIKKSRFITYLHRIQSEEDAKEFLKLVKKTHPDATHHCYAYRLKGIDRSNDDGEPSGTAGMPMLQVLTGRDLEDVIAVVVRYFGGTLLGTGGLVKAYSSSVAKALENVRIVDTILVPVYQLEVDDQWLGKIDHWIRQAPNELLDFSYTDKARYTFSSPQNPNPYLANLSSGELQAVEIGQREQEADVAG